MGFANSSRIDAPSKTCNSLVQEIYGRIELLQSVRQNIVWVQRLFLFLPKLVFLDNLCE
jgi:hypothetical protein